MNAIPFDQLLQRISQLHAGDQSQLDVIYSNSSRILVEAPAGYGKTKTLISRIAFLLSTNAIPYPKKILTLAFSINAAYKIKKDVMRELPILMGANLLTAPMDIITVSNYHGFCRNLLRRCGSSIFPSLTSIDTFESFSDERIDQTQERLSHVTLANATFASEFSDQLRVGNDVYLEDNLDRYVNLVVSDYLPHNAISYNGILAITLQILRKNIQVRSFYSQYFSMIIIDEFQDTNFLSFEITKQLVTNSTRLLFLGDPLQRIYGFIGAIRNIMPLAQTHFSMQKMSLANNHRFSANQTMLALDNAIRKNAEHLGRWTPSGATNAKHYTFANQTAEADYVVRTAASANASFPDSRIAVLVKQRGPSTDAIVHQFDQQGIQYFFGIFTDDDPLYVGFHQRALNHFLNLIRDSSTITKKLFKDHIQLMQMDYIGSQLPVIASLLKLLTVFWSRIFTEYSTFQNQDKIALIKDTFSYNGLKQYIDSQDARITISTIHAAKGLEWDYVILPDVEQDIFPGWNGLCGGCGNRGNCNLVINASNQSRFLDELSVFYVAVTRAKVDVLFTSSNTAPRRNGGDMPRNVSCFLRLPGIL